jgi:class 3 adenylate cyclase/tetratricopeptide (TPR) repeat protein
METPGLRKERKVVTVLFADLVGFTSRAEELDPEDVEAILRPYHERLRAELERHGGTVEKFIGDAVMALFGAPIAHEDDPERAIRAALAIRDWIAEEGELELRIAVNTGEALVNLGARPEAGEGMASGDVVNTTARLQSAAPVNGILAGEATYRATSHVINYREGAPVDAKGKAEPVPVWEAVEARSRFGVDVPHEATTALVGRQRELAVLRDALERARQEPSSQLVTLVGVPGMGKSRLVYELFQLIEADAELINWRQGRSLPYGEGVSFWALAEMVKAQAGILETDGVNEAEAKLAGMVAQLIPEARDQEWILRHVRALAGAAGSDASVPREESFAAWRHFFEALAELRPLVLVFEDLHWADDGLLEFVDHLVEWASGVPILVVGTARPELLERRPGWGGGKPNATTLSLAPLSDDDTTRLIGALLGRAVLAAEKQTVLLARSGGNPLYAEQYVRMLAERADDEELPLPESIQGIIAARLDALAPAEKTLLQDAAVIGKVFWPAATAALGGAVEPSALDESLHALERKQFVRRERRSSVRNETEYSFLHVLVRDVAYGQIPRSKRVHKHGAAAEWIERLAGDRVIDHAELVAYHYVQGLELARLLRDVDEVEKLEPRARRFLELAGDRVYALDVERAESHYRRALELTPPGDRARGRLLARLGDVAQYTGRLSETEQLLGRAIEEFREHGDSLGAGEAMVTLVLALWRLGRTEQSRRQVLAEAIEILEREAPGAQLARAYARAATDSLLGGRPAECIEWSRKALALADQLGLTAAKCRPLLFLGSARFELGDLSGLDDMREALRLGLEAGLGWETGTAYSNLGECVWVVDGPAAGLELKREALEFSERRGLLYFAKYIRAEMLWLLFDLGHWDEVLAYADEALAWDREHGGSQVSIVVLPMKARVLLSRGAAAVAAPLELEYLPRAREIGDYQVLVPALGAAAATRYATGDRTGALELIEELAETTRSGLGIWAAYELAAAARICAAIGAGATARRLFPPETAVATARVRHSVASAGAVLSEQEGDLEQATRLYADAAKGWHEYGCPSERAYALLGEGRCLVALGRAGEADVKLREASDVAGTLEARPLVAEAEALLAEVAASS